MGIAKSGTDELREKRFNRLQRWMISSRDFAIVRSAATFLLEEVDEEKSYPLAEIRRLKCYETAMVIAYARPFSMAKGEVGPLTEKDINLKRSDPFYPTHSKLIQKRNTLFGHSDADHVEMRVLNLNVVEGFHFALPRFGEHLEFSLGEIETIYEQTGVVSEALVKKWMAVAPEFKERFITPSRQ